MRDVAVRRRRDGFVLTEFCRRSSRRGGAALLQVVDALVALLQDYAYGDIQRHGTRWRRVAYGILSVCQRWSHLLVYLVMFVNALVYANAFALLFPLSLFAYALLESPRPSKRYWRFVFGWTVAVIVAKFIYQLPLFCACYNTASVYRAFDACSRPVTVDAGDLSACLIATEAAPTLPQLVGLVKYQRLFALAVAWDVLLLLVLSLNQYWMKQLGLWEFLGSFNEEDIDMPSDDEDDHDDDNEDDLKASGDLDATKPGDSGKKSDDKEKGKDKEKEPRAPPPRPTKPAPAAPSIATSSPATPNTRTTAPGAGEGAAGAMASERVRRHTRRQSRLVITEDGLVVDLKRREHLARLAATSAPSSTAASSATASASTPSPPPSNQSSAEEMTQLPRVGELDAGDEDDATMRELEAASPEVAVRASAVKATRRLRRRATLTSDLRTPIRPHPEDQRILERLNLDDYDEGDDDADADDSTGRRDASSERDDGSDGRLQEPEHDAEAAHSSHSDWTLLDATSPAASPAPSPSRSECVTPSCPPCSSFDSRTSLGRSPPRRDSSAVSTWSLLRRPSRCSPLPLPSSLLPLASSLLLFLSPYLGSLSRALVAVLIIARHSLRQACGASGSASCAATMRVC